MVTGITSKISLPTSKYNLMSHFENPSQKSFLIVKKEWFWEKSFVEHLIQLIINETKIS